LLHTQEVAGSNPASRTSKTEVQASPWSVHGGDDWDWESRATRGSFQKQIYWEA
jgi:hypothetical protein